MNEASDDGLEVTGDIANSYTQIKNLKFDSLVYVEDVGGVTLVKQRIGGEAKYTNLKYENYFFVKKDLSEERIENYNSLFSTTEWIVEETKMKSLFGDELIKIKYNDYNKALLQSLDPNECLETDIKPSYRVLLNEEVSYSKEPKILYLDIETDMSTDFKHTPVPVISIACYDSVSKKFLILGYRSDKLYGEDVKGDTSYVNFSNEIDMLNYFYNYCRRKDFDVVAGWNVNFDMMYLYNRSEKLHVDFTRISSFYGRSPHIAWPNDKGDALFLRGIQVVDLLELHKKITMSVLDKPELNSLDVVSNFYLGEGKTKHKGIDKLWREDYENLLVYNKNDVVLLIKLVEKLHMLEYLFNLQSIVPAKLQDCMFNSKIIDQLVLSHYKDKFAFPTKQQHLHEDYPGALVIEPKKGIYKNVVVFDFSSMYPNIILSANMSPETVGHGDVDIDGIHFDGSVDSIYSGIIKTIIERRMYYKNKLEEYKYGSKEYDNAEGIHNTYKVLLNSFYGVSAYKNYRLHDVRIAKSITYFGRDMILNVKNYLKEKHNLDTLYIDTDSVFVRFDESLTLDELKSTSLKVLETINSEYLPQYIKKFNIKEKCYQKMGLNYIFSSIMFIEGEEIVRVENANGGTLGKKRIHSTIGIKKKYAGIMMKENKKTQEYEEFFYTRGFEVIRRDTPRFFKNELKNVLKLVVKFKSQEEINVYLQDLKQRVKKLTINDLWMSKRSSVVGEYKSHPQHIRAMEYSNKYLGTHIEVTDEFKMLFVKTYGVGKELATDVVCIDDNLKEFPAYIQIDHDKYYQFFIENKIEDFFDIRNSSKLTNFM